MTNELASDDNACEGEGNMQLALQEMKFKAACFSMEDGNKIRIEHYNQGDAHRLSKDYWNGSGCRVIHHERLGAVWS